MSYAEITNKSTGQLALSATGLQILQQGTVTWTSSGGGKSVDSVTGALRPTDFAILTLQTFTSVNSNTNTGIRAFQESNSQFSFTPISADFRGVVQYYIVRSTAPIATVT